MLSRLSAALVLGLALALPAMAQPGQPIPVPGGIIDELKASGDSMDVTAEALPAHLEARRLDLNGDGRAEVLVSGRLRLCFPLGVNCRQWVYARESGGRYHRLLATWGSSLNPLATRTHGWRDLAAPLRLSSMEASRSVFRFDGRRYVDVSTEVHLAEQGLVFRVVSPVPAPGRPRTVRLEPRPLADGSAVRVSAEYRACEPARATPGRLCGAPLLVLSKSRGGRLLPVPGAACFRLEVDISHGQPYPGGPVSCRAAQPSPATGRAVALRLTPEQWRALERGTGFTLTAGATVLQSDGQTAMALENFVWRVWEINGIPLHPES